MAGVIDLREDPRTDLVMAQQIGGAIGGVAGQYYNRKLRKKTTELMVKTISDHVAGGGTAQEGLDKFRQIFPQAQAQTEADIRQEQLDAELTRRYKEAQIQKTKLQTFTDVQTLLSKKEQGLASYKMYGADDGGEADPVEVKRQEDSIAEIRRILQGLSPAQQPQQPVAGVGEIGQGKSSTVQPRVQPRLQGQTFDDIALKAQEFIEANPDLREADKAKVGGKSLKEILTDAGRFMLGKGVTDSKQPRLQEQPQSVPEQPVSKVDQEIAEAVAEVPKIKDEAEFDALPSGTVFIDPEGNRRRKP